MISLSNSQSLKMDKSVISGNKFVTEFCKNAKVKSVMGGNNVIGLFEAKLMLAYFRNIEPQNIDSSDIGLRYLENRSVRHLKRSLREMNETVRRTLYYGTDFIHIHQQHLLGNDELNETDDNEINNISQNISNTAINDIEITFNPLKDAQNLYIKPNTPLNFKKNFEIKHFKQTTPNMNIMPFFEDEKDNELRSKLPYIDEKYSFHEQFKQSTSTTKMFGKFFDKRGSNISHDSIWSESESDDDDDDNNYNSDDSQDLYVLTQFNDDSESDTDNNSNFSNNDHDNNTKKIHSQNKLQIPDNNNYNKPPAKCGKKHISQFSFASSVSLGSDNTPRSPQNNTDNNNIPTIQEHKEIEHKKHDHNDKTDIVKQQQNKSLKTNKFNKNRKERKKIDSLLLSPENHPQFKHEVNCSLDSFLSDIVIDIPEPTAVEKLKYHLTEPRIPPTRRKTYHYSHT